MDREKSTYSVGSKKMIRIQHSNEALKKRSNKTQFFTSFEHNLKIAFLSLIPYTFIIFMAKLHLISLRQISCDNVREKYLYT